jgi:hypothetical protein
MVNRRKTPCQSLAAPLIVLLRRLFEQFSAEWPNEYRHLSNNVSVRYLIRF